jgi:hypothetical protein
MVKIIFDSLLILAIVPFSEMGVVEADVTVRFA